jgi:hypothetical protein
MIVRVQNLLDSLHDFVNGGFLAHRSNMDSHQLDLIQFRPSAFGPYSALSARARTLLIER